MAAYMISFTTMIHSDWIESYRDAVAPMIERAGGEYLAVGLAPEILEGPVFPLDAITVFRFPTMDAVRTFMESEEYQPWRKVRQDGAKAQIFAFESTI